MKGNNIRCGILCNEPVVEGNGFLLSRSLKCDGFFFLLLLYCVMFV